MHVRWSLPVALTLTALAAQAAPTAPSSQPPGSPVAAAAAVAPALTSGLFLQNFDRTVRPQDDLYRFVNGTWLKTTEIPADKSNYGSFTRWPMKREKNLRVIVEEAAAAKAAPGTAPQLDRWISTRAIMDEAKAEPLGARRRCSPNSTASRAIADRKRPARLPVARAAADASTTDRCAVSCADAKNPESLHAVGVAGGLSACRSATTTSTEQRIHEIRGAYDRSYIDNVLSSPAVRTPTRSRRT